MCIYCNTTNYRKIYENHYGPIPKDETGRTYEIHHIDGNRKNNNPGNLKCVSIQEHYDIHYSQGDWAACAKMANRMNIPIEEASRIASECTSRRNKEFIAEGKHNLMKKEDGSSLSKTRVQNGTHNWLDGKVASKTQQRLVKEGTHHFLGGELQRKYNIRRLEKGIHPFLGGEMQKKIALDRVKNGTHPSQIFKSCPHCGITVNSMMYGRFHGDKCSKLTNN